MRASFKNKKGIMMAYSIVLFLVVVVIMFEMTIAVFKMKKTFNNRMIGGEALNILTTENNGELARLYVQSSAQLALNKTIDLFTSSSGEISPEGVYPILKNTNLHLSFIQLYESNLKTLLFNNPYKVSSNYSVFANFTHGITLIGVPKSPSLFLAWEPVQTFNWPMKEIKDKKIITKDGCYGPQINDVLNKIDSHKGLTINSTDKTVYSVADNGRVVKISVGKMNEPCMDPKTKRYNYLCEGLNYYGNYVIVDYGDFMVRYAHLSEVDVVLGSTVNKGTIIGKAGRTGVPYGGNVLFFQVLNKNGEPINPLCFYDKVYFQRSKEANCLKCNEPKYSVFIPFKVHSDKDITNFDDIQKTFLSVKTMCSSSKDFRKCVQSQALALRGQGYNVKLMNNCEKGINKSFVNLSAFIEDCANSHNDSCYCDYPLTNLFKNYPSVIKNNKEFFITFDQGSSGLRIELLNADKKMLRQVNIRTEPMVLESSLIEPLTKELIVDFYNDNPFIEMPIRHFSKELVILKQGNKILFVYPNEIKEVKKKYSPCTLDNTTVRICANGLKFEINNQTYISLS